MGLGRRSLIILMSGGFLAVTAWAQFETIFALWADAKLEYGPRDIGLLLTFIGVIGAVVQGGAIGKLTKNMASVFWPWLLWCLCLLALWGCLSHLIWQQH